MSVPFWVVPGEEGSLWDFLYLGDRVWPGIWSVKLSKSRSVDKAKANTQDGYTLTNRGYQGAPLTATGRMWTSNQLDTLQSFIAKYDPEFSKIAEPLDIYHPACEILTLDRVFISKMALDPPGPGAKYTTLTLEMDQWFKPTQIKKAKPVGFKGTSLASAPLDPAAFRVDPPKV